MTLKGKIAQVIAPPEAHEPEISERQHNWDNVLKFFTSAKRHLQSHSYLFIILKLTFKSRKFQRVTGS